MPTLRTVYSSVINIVVSAASALNADLWAESDIVVNATTTRRYVDAMLSGRITLNASATTDDVVEIYCYGGLDQAVASALGGSLNGGLDGNQSVETEGTAFNYENLHLIGVITADVANGTIYWGPWSVAQVFGGVLPQRWGVMIHNNTSGALGADPILQYEGINYDSS